MSPRKFMVPLMLSLALLAGGCKGGSTNASTPVAPQASVTASSQSAPTQGAAPVDANGCPTSNTTSFAKTKFVLHTGLAFGAFHRYLYKPFRAGTFTSGGKLHRVVVFAKAGAAALFIKREVRLASEDVKANPTLCKTLAAPLAKIGDGISGVVTKLKGGDTSGITDAQNSITSLEGQAASGGAAIKEDPNASIG